MAALSFKPRFAKKVENGKKNQTIRNFRKVPILPFEHLYLYMSMRTKFCRKLGEGQCTGTNIITIEKNSYTIHGMLTAKITDSAALNRFAKKDGFSSWGGLQQFWIKEHGPDCFPFKGTIIYWNVLEKKDWKKPGKTNRKFLSEQFS